MKKLLLLIAIFALSFGANAQQKAFGDYYFGMTKKEAKTAFKANKKNHRIEIGGWEFIATPYNCEFGADGLYQVSMFPQAQPMKMYLDIGNTELLLKEIKDIFTAAGYETEKEHVFWPKPSLMDGDSYCIIMRSKAMQKFVIVRMPNVMKSVRDNYDVWIDIVPQSHADKLAEMKNKRVNDKADELKSKL